MTKRPNPIKAMADATDAAFGNASSQAAQAPAKRAGRPITLPAPKAPTKTIKGKGNADALRKLADGDWS